MVRERFLIVEARITDKAVSEILHFLNTVLDF